MEDRVEVAREFYQLNSRRGIIHRAVADVLSREKDADSSTARGLATFDLQSRSFYTFFNHLYEWYIRKEEGDSATHFWLPLRGNPWLSVTYAPGREEEELQRLRENITESDQLMEERAGDPGGKRMTPYQSFEQLQPENQNELFAESLPNEVSFYLGHVILNGISAHHKKPAKNYLGLISAIMSEAEALQAFAKNNERYVRSILEKQFTNCFLP